MAIHLINQQHQAFNAVRLVAEGDTVIVTNEEIDVGVIAALADRKVSVALLTGTSPEASAIATEQLTRSSQRTTGCDTLPPMNP